MNGGKPFPGVRPATAAPGRGRCGVTLHTPGKYCRFEPATAPDTAPPVPALRRLCAPRPAPAARRSPDAAHRPAPGSPRRSCLCVIQWAFLRRCPVIPGVFPGVCSRSSGRCPPRVARPVAPVCPRRRTLLPAPGRPAAHRSEVWYTGPYIVGFSGASPLCSGEVGGPPGGIRSLKADPKRPRRPIV